MSPRRSKAIALPSGETSTEIHVPSRASNSTTRASGRGALMSAAGSFFAGEAAGFAARGAAETSPAPTRTTTGRMDLVMSLSWGALAARPPDPPRSAGMNPATLAAVTAGGSSGAIAALPLAFAKELLQARAAFGRSFAVERGQLRQGLLMARLRLHRFAVHGLGAALELARAIEIAQGHERVGLVGALLDDALEQLLGAASPVRVLQVRAGEQHLGLDLRAALQPRNGRLEELNGVPILLFLERLLGLADRLHGEGP